jgi:hypothetical protein
MQRRQRRSPTLPNAIPAASRRYDTIRIAPVSASLAASASRKRSRTGNAMKSKPADADALTESNFPSKTKNQRTVIAATNTAAASTKSIRAARCPGPAATRIASDSVSSARPAT